METDQILQEHNDPLALSNTWKVLRGLSILALFIPWFFLIVFLIGYFTESGSPLLNSLTWLITAPFSLVLAMLYPILAVLERRTHGYHRFWWLVSFIASVPLLIGILFMAADSPSVFGPSG